MGISWYTSLTNIGWNDVQHTDTGAVEMFCGVKITLRYLAVRQASLGLVDAGKTLPD